MPELPEVQTVVDDLNKKIKNNIITDFWSAWPKTVKSHNLDEFKKNIIGHKVIGVRRLGKNIFIDIENNKTIYIHLKMTGHLLVKPQVQNDEEKKYFSDRVNQYIHHKWFFDDGKTMEFSDVRKFGKIVLVDTDKIADLKDMQTVGIDIMDEKFTLKKFKEILDMKQNKMIGFVILEQHLMTGIGNIYRSEILFDAGISPFRLVSDLREEEIKKVYKSIFKILNKAIELRGTSDSDYRDTSGAPGSNQKVLKVYKKLGEECRKKCDGKIKRNKIAGRSVFYCEKCQK